MSSVNVRMMSGDILSFAIEDGDTFRDLRDEFYYLMSEELDIDEIECVTFFDKSEIGLDDIVDPEKMYSVFITHLTLPRITLRWERKIVVEHIYGRQLPEKAIVNVVIPKDQLDNAYRFMYNKLVKFYDEEIYFRQQENEDEGIPNCKENLPPTFVEYIAEYITEDGQLTINELIKEYIKIFVSNRIKIKDVEYIL
jgi:hypothetical protein